ncbi:MAG: hypothetical protein R3D25_17225 [Geminicoccaceae bacterium]
MTMTLAPTARGLRLIKATRSPRIELPSSAGPAALLVSDTDEPIVTETGVQLATGSMP